MSGLEDFKSTLKEFKRTRTLGNLEDVEEFDTSTKLSKTRIDSTYHLEFAMETDKEFLSKFGKNEVTIPDIIYTTGLDVDNGLIDQKIFGPVVDYTCKCQQLQSILYAGMTCPNCGMKIESSDVRKTRFGYFKLNVPMLNPLFSAIIVRKILGFRKDEWQEILFSPNHFFIREDPNGDYRYRKSKDEKGYTYYGNLLINQTPSSDNPEDIYLGCGIFMIEKYQELVDIKYNASSYFDNKPNLLDYLSKNLYTKICRLIPTAYREVYYIDGSPVVDSLNIAYKNILDIASRIKYWKVTRPDYLTFGGFWFDIRVLYDILNRFYYSGNLTFDGKDTSTYKSLLSTKFGLIRNGLLSKVSIESARSVTTPPSPEQLDLSEDEVLIPYVMAKNLYKPMLISILTKRYGKSYYGAMTEISNDSERVRRLLYTKFNNRYGYITRAPALHQMSFSGWKFKINPDIKDKSFKIPSVLNVPFNQDNDGDTMAIFPVLTQQSEDELIVKSTPSVNPFYPKTGDPIYSFNLEYIYGLFYATYPMNPKDDKAKYHYDNEYIIDDQGRKVTVGSKHIKEEIFDKLGCSKYYEYGDILDKKKINNIIKRMSVAEPIKTFTKVLQALYEYATVFTESGISLTYDDLVKVDKTEINKSKTPIEYELAEKKVIKKFEEMDPTSNRFMTLMKSGAKGNYTQLKQIMIGKGPLIDVNGNYLPIIKHSLMEGLTAEEFMTTIYAGRRGLAYKSLSTAQTGYLYYRLVKSMRDIIISEEDCGTTEGIDVYLKDSNGRTLNQEFGGYHSGIIITLDIYNDLMARFKGDTIINIRSPLKCKCTDSVCSKCYGINIGRGRPSEKGDRVGIIASFSLSEVMTQAMLKNFHTSGASSVDMISIKNTTDKVIPTVKVQDLDKNLVRIDIESSNETWILPKIKSSITKTENIEPNEEIFKFGYTNDDIGRQYQRLESIVDMKTISNEESAWVAPYEGTLKFLELIDSSEMVHDPETGLDFPKNYRYYKVQLSNDKLGLSDTYYIPYNKIIIVPFNSVVKKGQIFTDGIPNMKEYSNIVSKEDFQKHIISDMVEIFRSQGVNIRPIHFELIARHLVVESSRSPQGEDLEDLDDLTDFEVESMIRLGMNRSFVQSVSLGYINEAYSRILDDLRFIGKTNAGKIALGTYE